MMSSILQNSPRQVRMFSYHSHNEDEARGTRRVQMSYLSQLQGFDPMQPTLGCLRSDLCGPSFLICAALPSTPYRHPAGCPVCPCPGEQNHPNQQRLHCPHQTWLSDPRTIPVSLVKSLTARTSQELQEGGMDDQVKEERRTGCCGGGAAGCGIEECPGK